jgi:hypothetical protein
VHPQLDPFAAIMMIMAGTFQFFAGLIAIFNDQLYVATTWG